MHSLRDAQFDSTGENESCVVRDAGARAHFKETLNLEEILQKLS